MKPFLAILTGAGISAESGLKTFRGAGGLWRGLNPIEVATPEAWRSNPALVLEFYNERRSAAAEAVPNAAHLALVRLEEKFTVRIVTQNVDDLHERAGSKEVLHLHGELAKARSTADSSLVYDIGSKKINLGDVCEKGSQLRPHIVWFGEAVTAMEDAVRIAEESDIFLIIGTSLAVYPASSLINHVSAESLKYIIDPDIPDVSGVANLHKIAKKATEGVPVLVEELLRNF